MRLCPSTFGCLEQNKRGENTAQEPEAAGWMQGSSSCIMSMKDAAQSSLHRGLSPSHLHSLTVLLCPPSLLCLSKLPPSAALALLSLSSCSPPLGLEPPSAWAFKSCDLASTDWSTPSTSHLYVQKDWLKLFYVCVTDSNSTHQYLPVTVRHSSQFPFTGPERLV